MVKYLTLRLTSAKLEVRRVYPIDPDPRPVDATIMDNARVLLSKQYIQHV
jgi:hypothetical protein